MEHQAQTYHSLVLRGKLRMAVRLITERETGRVLQLRDRCMNTGDRVMEVLCAKHTASLDSYPDCPPELTLVDITNDTVLAVAGRLSVGDGTGGIESVSLQHWLLKFGAASGELRLIVGDFMEWLGNGRPPWAAYRDLMSGQLIMLDKQPGIRLVRVGETWRQMMAKFLLRVAGSEAKSA